MCTQAEKFNKGKKNLNSFEFLIFFEEENVRQKLSKKKNFFFF